MSDETYTNQKVIYLVVGSQVVFAVVGLVFTFLLCLWKVEGSMIAVVSGLTGTSLGNLAGVLSNTKTKQEPPAPKV